jgi:carbamoyl-phosphate synthase large subunit
VEQALLTSLKAIGFQMPRKNILITIGKLEDKVDMLPAIAALEKMGFSLFCTGRTHEFLASRGLKSALLYKISEPRSPNIREYLESKRVDLVINIPQHASSTEKTDGYFIRRIATDRGIPLITNVQLAKRIIEAIQNLDEHKDMPLIAWPDVLQSHRH